jgi:hypothetical protein
VDDRALVAEPRRERADRRVLDRRHHDRAGPGARGAEHRERVGLGAPAGPHDVADPARIAERSEQAAARGVDVGARRGALRVLRARVAPCRVHHLGHRGEHVVGDARRRGVVEIDCRHI